ncbi:MAG TPA: DMT family transporter [Azospirillaceae bacterium]|nr:DMT family transporter [Azospirillaceae bacterium]
MTPPSSARGLGRLAETPYLLLTLAPLFWSGNFVLGRAVHADVPPVALAFWRWALGFLIVLPFAWKALRRDRAAIRQGWKMLAVLAFLGIAAFNTLVYLGLQTTTAISGLLMQSTMPVLIMALSFVLLGDRITPRQGVGVVVSLVGAVVVITRGDMGALVGLALNRGDLLIFLAVVGYAFYSVLLRRRPPIGPVSFLAVTFGMGAAMLLPLVAWEGMTGRVPELNRVTLLSVGYVTVFPSILAYLCFNRGVQLVGPNRAGLFIHLLPLFGSVLAVMLLGEAFLPAHAIGMALILGGIALATLGPKAV